jgi:hypothetical protein
MRRSTKTTILAAAVTVALVTACGTDTTEPVSPPFTAASAAVSARGLTAQLAAHVRPLSRPTALANDLTVSKSIGILGGTLTVPGAGVTVIVPPGAVLQTTTISMTARRGQNFAYDFAPHGLVFALPLTIIQDVKGAKNVTNPLSVTLGYYPNSLDVTSVTEMMPVIYDPFTGKAVSTIRHFSGYIFAGGLDEM